MIVKNVDIKKAINELLKNTFPQIRLYGKEVTQGHIRPCFFVEMHGTSSQKNKIYIDHTVTIFITYLQDAPNELEALQIWDVLNEKIQGKLEVGDRWLNVEDKDYNWTGKDSNILQIEIELEYTDTIVPKETNKKMKKLELGGL